MYPDNECRIVVRQLLLARVTHDSRDTWSYFYGLRATRVCTIGGFLPEIFIVALSLSLSLFSLIETSVVDRIKRDRPRLTWAGLNTAYLKCIKTGRQKHDAKAKFQKQNITCSR